MEKLRDLTSKKPRDISGPRSSNRFDYQKDWAILKMMELYETNENFLLVMDYYDDVVVYDSDIDPENVSFFQIKTAAKNWTIKELTKRKEGKMGPTLSILGKMYECKMQFPNHTLSLNFISNYTYNLKLLSGEKSVTKSRVCLAELSEETLGEVINKVIAEHKLKDNPDFIEITFFEVSELLIHNRETYLKGKLSEFIERQNPDSKYKISLVYDALFSEVKVKNNYEGEISGFDELAKRKGISRKQFQEYVEMFSENDKEQEMWDLSFDSLVQEGIPFSDRLKLKQAWNHYKVDKTNYANLPLKKIISQIKESLKKYKNKNINYLNIDLLQPVYMDYLKANPHPLYNEFYIKVIILMEYCKDE
ncbi:dsDNA nuclease domain-containing protein [Bacillus cytotoxicus]